MPNRCDRRPKKRDLHKLAELGGGGAKPKHEIPLKSVIELIISHHAAQP